MHTAARTKRAATHAPMHQSKTVHLLEAMPGTTTLTSAPCSN
eukprot:CAMPEP_0115245416 /NCGR_PEP_ID=MMETSP0270-20121206/40500_1 /TAXON_ID=71861 /ORGANISM="Scrippsiella trochoidea, Strain CCMP3099" /LENGTH=41 /DNA_ID= /DNA_START= /DNA_END= /DNA_ORIENTATION=